MPPLQGYKTNTVDPGLCPGLSHSSPLGKLKSLRLTRMRLRGHDSAKPNLNEYNPDIQIIFECRCGIKSVLAPSEKQDVFVVCSRRRYFFSRVIVQSDPILA